MGIEDAEHVTRIPRKYLLALEEEDYSILPAPVYARGFLRSYAGYLGLDAKDLLPFFPAGKPPLEEEVQMEPVNKLGPERRRTNSPTLLMFGGVALLLAIAAVYGFGQEGDSSPLLTGGQAPAEASSPVASTGGSPPQGGDLRALPDFAGLTAAEATSYLNSQGASYVIIGVGRSDVPQGQVIDQTPGPGESLAAGETVNLIISR